jgi:sterol desaturase/sphingolipid hydroxylase (fatty acid hydroxylase superfamily)
MSHYTEAFATAFSGYANWLWGSILHPGWDNYVTILALVSLLAFLAEQVSPWRKQQARIRRDFWLDGFYVVFNFFLFSLLGYAALSEVVALAFNELLHATFGWENLVALKLDTLPVLAQLVIFFVLRDFVHWNIHRLLHRTPRLWEFHKVHHSVQEMGFAAHLRYHWAETLVYRTLEYIPMAMLGFGITDFFIVHTIALAIGHLNHSNVAPPYGPLRYILNSPQMHIWHHAKAQPGATGCNFGLSLSIWDWLFNTAYWPHDAPDEPLGFDGIDDYPKGFFRQITSGFGRRKGR